MQRIKPAMRGYTQFFYFFQAEDGIRDKLVTGVQTCALPIWTRLRRIVVLLSALTIASVPAFAQVELSGSYAIRMYEDYIERGPGSYMGDFTGMPMSDEGGAQAVLYSSDLPSPIERQGLAPSPLAGQYRPLGLRIWSEVDNGRVV